MSIPEKPIPLTFDQWLEASPNADSHDVTFLEAVWLAGQEAMRERAIIAVTCEKRPVSIAASIRALKPE